MNAANEQAKRKIAMTVGKNIPGCRCADIRKLTGNEYFFSVAYMDAEKRNMGNLHLLVYFEEGTPYYFIVERVISSKEALRLTPGQIEKYIQKNEVMTIGDMWFSGKKLSSFQIQDLSRHAQKQPLLEDIILDDLAITKQTQVGEIVENAKLMQIALPEIKKEWEDKNGKETPCPYDKSLEEMIIGEIAEKCRIIHHFTKVAVKHFEQGYVVYIGNDNKERKCCCFRVLTENTKCGVTAAVQQVLFGNGNVMFRNLTGTLEEVSALFSA